MLNLPTREQVQLEVEALTTQIDYESPAWKTFERFLRADRWLLALDLLSSTADDKVRGKAAYNDRLLNMAEQARRSRRPQPIP